MSFKLVVYGVHNPVCQQSKEQMCVGSLVLLMIDRTKVEIRLQLAVGTFSFSNQVVIVPSGLLVYFVHVGAQEVHVIVLVHTFRQGDAPPDALLCSPYWLRHVHTL